MLARNRSRSDMGVILIAFLAIGGIGVWWIAPKLLHRDETERDGRNRMPADTYEHVAPSFLETVILGDGSFSKESVVLLDARPLSVWERGHIIGSLSFPATEAMTLSLPKTEENATFVLIGSGEGDEILLAATLEKRGISHDRIKIFDDTYANWASSRSLIVEDNDPSSPIAASKVRLIRIDEAKTLLESSPEGRIFLLDVRQPEAFASGHLPGAINIPFDEIEKRRNEIPSARTLLAYGSTDHESFATGALLFDLGFFDTLTLDAGFQPAEFLPEKGN